jgi:hypothetical protein
MKQAVNPFVFHYCNSMGIGPEINAALAERYVTVLASAVPAVQELL